MTKGVYKAIMYLGGLVRTGLEKRMLLKLAVYLLNKGQGNRGSCMKPLMKGRNKWGSVLSSLFTLDRTKRHEI